MFAVAVAAAALALTARDGAQTPRAAAERRNVIIFVADGLRHGSVNGQDMPALSALRAQGTDFQNSYSLFPTFTMANASAIATGHKLGDTGIFSNTLWVRYPTFETGNFHRAPGTPIPFIENPAVLGDLDAHFDGNVLGEQTLLAAARSAGYDTAAVGKLGPAVLQDIAAIAPEHGDYPSPLPSILVDDSTGAGGPPLPPAVLQRLTQEGLALEAPSRTNGFGAGSQYSNGNSGDRTHAGTLMPNLVQQQWFADVTTRAILPMFEGDGKPFALVYWSRDPDASQHNEGDSLGALVPGINGPTTRKGLQNADRNLGQLLSWLDAHPAIKANTDVFITSDHGFATISRHELDRSGRPSARESAQHAYVDAGGRVDTEKGTLPSGFLAIDLAFDFHLNLFDPDRRVLDAGRTPYRAVRINSSDAWEHPSSGNGLLGQTVEKLDGSDARIIVAANGGADLVYVPDESADLVQRVCERVLGYDYVGGVYVNDRFGPVPGTLPMSAVGLIGSTAVPQPALVVVFRTFYLNPDDLQTAVQVSDTSLQEGQGMHGGFGRECTYNTMAASGPDFKAGYADPAPVSNADIVPTVARILGLAIPAKGTLRGRVIAEALSGASSAPGVQTRALASVPAQGARTVLFFQELDGERYAEASCRMAAAPAETAASVLCRR